MSTDRNFQGLPQRLDPTHVVGVVMSEPDGLNLEMSLRNDLKKTLLFLGIRARRIDNDDLSVPKENTIGMGRRGQCRSAQGHDHHSRAVLEGFVGASIGLMNLGH